MTHKVKAVDQRIDYAIILPVFFLVLIGFVSIYAATYHDYPQHMARMLIQQGLWILFGSVLAFILMFFKRSFLWKLTPYLYGLGLMLMVLPLLFYSPQLVAATGAKNWISLGSVTLFQPSEFMKISYILVMARLTVWFRQGKERSDLKADWQLLGLYALVTLPVMVLLALQKDFGTALVFFAILSGMVLIAGISWRIILPILLVLVLLLAGFFLVFLLPQGKELLYHLGMDTYKINRISAWLTPFDFSETIAYQQTQSMISIGSGGFRGKGFNVIDLPVPVRESDMIFTVIAENFGFIGSTFLLTLYLLLIYRMVRVTFELNNLFYTYIATGFIMMILFHIFENIGAATGILPLTGIPLPFISQGGSALISNLIGVGLILSMHYQHTLAKEAQSEKELRRSFKYQ
ncbi:FtsW/RodA/SpoVE family cell cycle protein [Streptococcus halichoeri]|uniref:FtsW/RodA/SpoVE family cell cycle protein n=1 Tax=Streptococcus halichoeri TaxID=254785 RepID=UPI0013576C8B|nr:FtsW/RodA/SpoVE family cell cycle protein [Streptococcus halichoeri]